VNKCVGSIGGKILTGKEGSSGTETRFSVTVSVINLMWIGLGSNTCLPSDRPAANRLVPRQCLYVTPRHRVNIVHNVHRDWSKQYFISDDSNGIRTVFVGREMTVPFPWRQNYGKLTITADYYVNRQSTQASIHSLTH